MKIVKRRSRTLVEQILALFIESGIVYLTFRVGPARLLGNMLTFNLIGFYARDLIYDSS
jgi:hypothetical protein